MSLDSAQGKTIMKSQRTQLRRLPNRGSYDPETMHAILDAGFLAHVGFQIDG